VDEARVFAGAWMKRGSSLLGLLGSPVDEARVFAVRAWLRVCACYGAAAVFWGGRVYIYTELFNHVL